MKKSVKMLLPALLVIMLVVLTACGGTSNGNNTPSNSNTANGNTNASDGGTGGEVPEEVTLDFWTISLKPTFDDYFNELIAEYEEANPHVTINWEDYPFDAVEARLLATMAGGDAPDVVNLNTEKANQIATKGALADLSTLISDETREGFFEGIYNATVYNGAEYALPWYTSTQVLFMNTRLLEQAGLDPSQPPTTRDELHEMGRQILEATGAAGYSNEFTAKSHLAVEGIPILTEDRSAAAFNSPEGIAAVEKTKALVEDGIVLKEIANFDAQVQYFASEQTAFALTGPTFINRIKTAAPEIYEATVAVGLPASDAGIVYSNSMNIVVPEGSKHKQEAANFAAFVTNADNQLKFSKVANTIPSTKASIEDPFFTESDGSLEAQAKIASVATLDISEEYALGVPGVADINSTIKASLEKIILDNADIEATLAEAEEQVNYLLSLEQ